ncbi:MAG: tetratricopeptide repeat protein [Candidatus Zixiibacteriota bacterium]
MSERCCHSLIGGFVVLFLAAPAALQSGEYPDESVREALLCSQTLLFNDHFAQADSVLSDQITVNPHDPSAYLFRAGALFAEMTDREENLHEPLFKQLLNTVDTLTLSVLDTCDSSTAAWMYLFRGHARAYRALWESKFGSSVRAMKLGLSTIDEYQAGLRRDSTVLDVYAGIGSYHYWKSARAGLLRWLFIFKNEKAKGIAELRLAADSSLLHRDIARSALIWVYLDHKDYGSAVALAEDFVRKYPEGKTFHWPMAQARFKQGQYAEAAVVFERLRSFFDTAPGNYFNLVECDYHLARCYSWMEDHDRLRETLTRFKTYSDLVPRSTQQRQSARLNYLRKMVAR